MIELSSDFRSLATRIYTFSFLCLAAKVLKITSISEAGVRIEFANAGLITGALATVTVLLTIAAVLKLMSDGVQTRLADEVGHMEVASLTVVDLGQGVRNRRSLYESHLGLIKWTALASFLIEALVPLAFGAATAWYAKHDVVEFLTAVTR